MRTGALLGVGILFLLVGGIVWLIARAVSQNRYATMTEEEYEQEARRTSMVGAGVIELQKHLSPHHKVEYLQQQDKRVEGEADASGDLPPEPPVGLKGLT